jgi:hypothetical protein
MGNSAVIGLVNPSNNPSPLVLEPDNWLCHRQADGSYICRITSTPATVFYTCEQTKNPEVTNCRATNFDSRAVCVEQADGSRHCQIIAEPPKQAPPRTEYSLLSQYIWLGIAAVLLLFLGFLFIRESADEESE